MTTLLTVVLVASPLWFYPLAAWILDTEDRGGKRAWIAIAIHLILLLPRILIGSAMAGLLWICVIGGSLLLAVGVVIWAIESPLMALAAFGLLVVLPVLAGRIAASPSMSAERIGHKAGRLIGRLVYH